MITNAVYCVNIGGLWIVDRRMGKTLSSWQGHDSPLIKISPIDENHFLSIAERSAYIWSIPSLTTSTNISDSRKIVSIKNMPENASSPLTAATTIVASFDSSYGGGSGMHGFLAPDIRASQQIHVLYGVSGHKLYAGCIRPPSDSSTAFSEKNYNGTREVSLISMRRLFISFHRKENDGDGGIDATAVSLVDNYR